MKQPFERGRRLRIENERPTFVVELSENIDMYKSSLSANARRSVFLDARKIEPARHSVTAVRNETELANYVEEIGRLHRARFGEMVFDTTFQVFLQRLACIDEPSIDVLITQIAQDDKVLSVTIDISASKSLYNLVLAFEPRSDSVSMGLLHLGKNTEYFSTKGYSTYDLLAGGGKVNPDYKRRLSTATRKVVDIRLIRSKGLLRLVDISTVFGGRS